MRHLITTSLFLSSLMFVASCADESQPSETPETAEANAASFRAARDVLKANSEEHTTRIMQHDQVWEIGLDELSFHADSSIDLQQMDDHLKAMTGCWNEAGEHLDTGNAFAALRELRAELDAHKTSMVTMVDAETAIVAEQIFHARQTPLFEELKSYCDSFVVESLNYNCSF